MYYTLNATTINMITRRRRDDNSATDSNPRVECVSAIKITDIHKTLNNKKKYKRIIFYNKINKKRREKKKENVYVHIRTHTRSCLINIIEMKKKNM